MKTDKEIISQLRLKITELEERIQFLTKKFAHSHDLMSYVIEHSRSAIAVHDRDLKYVFVSEKYLHEYNVKEKDIIGRHHYEIFPDLPQKWRDVHQRALHGEVISAEDDPYEKADGSIEWTRWECRPWFESDGSIGGIIVYTEVITKRKEAEFELIRAKERAEESDRLKSAFLQNMSHEVRTPLNTIVGFSQLISESSFSTPELRFYSDIIASSNERLIDIISDVIDISQIRTNQVKTAISQTDLQMIASKIAGAFKGTAVKRNLDFLFTSKIDKTSTIALTDSRKVERIFHHLVDNALKFTNNGYVRITTSIENNSFSFEVIDSGIGIPLKMQEKVFEPFRQVETDLSRTYGGNGLGLSIVKAYTELLHGTIYLDSKPGKGTTVRVLIPMEIN
ncbi:MAG TPA: PAS domain-containing sensor histidine kinase [Bacteroidales bacterium]|nr:PAS domain-containing sensor histidine kinase [Bacteroidales bacterium]